MVVVGEERGGEDARAFSVFFFEWGSIDLCLQKNRRRARAAAAAPCDQALSVAVLSLSQQGGCPLSTIGKERAGRSSSCRKREREREKKRKVKEDNKERKKNPTLTSPSLSLINLPERQRQRDNERGERLYFFFLLKEWLFISYCLLKKEGECGCGLEREGRRREEEGSPALPPELLLPKKTSSVSISVPPPFLSFARTGEERKLLSLSLHGSCDSPRPRRIEKEVQGVVY